ncbi:TonB-dependent receptor [Sphingomonas sp. GB1N7]|uniref:TonB-dependent receptor n=1 Tax=Parasphingomonas caseinilytica TaxID=3096158 RepID=UPI002FCBABF9
MTRSTSRILLAGTASLLALSALPVQAQETPPTEATVAADDGEIVITARRREERAQTVPVSVTAFNDAMLRDKAVTTISDLTYITPGLNVAPQTSRDTPSLVIRGQRRAVSGAGAPAVVTYFADVPLPNEGSIMPTFDIGSIQVLKGPQGTLFGRNTTGGALLVYGKAPSYIFGGYAEATYGSYDERTFEGAINVPIIADAVALRVAGQITRRDGYTKNIGVGGNLDDRHADAIRASLLIEPFSGVSNTTIFDYNRARENGTGLVANGVFPNPAVAGGGNARTAAARPFFDCGVAGCDVDIALADQRARGVRTVATNIAPRSDRDFWGVANTTLVEGAVVSAKNIFGYRSTRVLSARDYDGTPLATYEGEATVNVQQVSNEFQLFGKAFADRLDWIVGGFYLKSQPNGLNNSVTRSAYRGGAQTSVENYISTESKAVFAQIGVDLAGVVDGLKLNAGGRYTWDSSSGCTVSAATTVPTIGSAACASRGGISGAADSKAPTWTIGLDYKVNGDVFTYIVARRGYRSGGFNRGGLAPTLAPYQSYAPETITDLEGGIKASWLMGDVRSRFNIAVYRGKYANVQRALTLGANFDGDNNAANDANSLIINAAKATISGAEFDAAFTLKGVTLSGFGSYTDAHYDQYDAIPVFVPLLGANPVANKFSYTPAWTLGAAVRYTHRLGGDLGDIGLNVNYFWSDKVWYVERPLDTNGIQKPYKLVNAKIDWSNIGKRGIDLGVFVRNMFDTNFASAGGVVTPAITTTTLVYNEPRVVGVQLRYSFGGR